MGKRPAKRGVGDTIEITASADAVWAVIADLESWGSWNPLYTSASGRPVVGTQLALTIALDGMKPQQARATVVSAEPGALLEYEVVNLAGLVRAFRFIEIAPRGPARCTVANYEIMSGPIGNLLARAIGDKVGQGLAAMNLALKARVEAG